MFFALIAFVLLFGGEGRYIIEMGFESLGRMVQNFIGLATYTVQIIFRRTGQFIIGRTGWSGVLPPHFLSAIFPEGELSDRRYWADMCLVSVRQL